MPHCLDLSGRVAVVVGGTSGIGRALARGLAEHGAHVVATGRRRQHVEDACREIESAGRQTLLHTADVKDRKSLDALRDAVIDRFGGVDILLNAAGSTFKHATASMSEEHWTRLFDTNLTGALRSCQSFHDSLRRSGHGRVINIVSLGSFLAFHEVAAYCAAKSALLSLTRSLACEWACDGICVNAIAPGIFPTEMNMRLVQDTPRGRELLMRTPMRRFGCPEELIGAGVLLASDAASFITGQCITVDGGFMASGVNS
jgi:NAD(P)-dependent dehydrogenase (short-subunit alcohol dehydrogenase family)